jgi:hypothetical protein
MHQTDAADKHHVVKFHAGICVRMARAALIEWRVSVAFERTKAARATRAIHARKRSLVRRHMAAWHAVMQGTLDRRWRAKVHTRVCQRRVRSRTCRHVLMAWRNACIHGTFVRRLCIHAEKARERLFLSAWARFTACCAISRELELACSKQVRAQAFSSWRKRTRRSAISVQSHVLVGLSLMQRVIKTWRDATRRGQLHIDDKARSTDVDAKYASSVACTPQQQRVEMNVSRMTHLGAEEAPGAHLVRVLPSPCSDVSDATPGPDHRIHFSARNAAMCVLQTLHDLDAHSSDANSKTLAAPPQAHTDRGARAGQASEATRVSSDLGDSTGLDLARSSQLGGRHSQLCEDESVHQARQASSYRIRKIVRAKVAAVLWAVACRSHRALAGCMLRAWLAHSRAAQVAR